jgi:hypothetical protein
MTTHQKPADRAANPAKSVVPPAAAAIEKAWHTLTLEQAGMIVAYSLLPVVIVELVKATQHAGRGRTLRAGK